LGLVFFFIASGLFLQGCFDPLAQGKIFIKSKEQSSVKMENRKLEIIKVVESILRQHEFTLDPSNSESVLLSMSKHAKVSEHKRTMIAISMYSEDNKILIHTMEWATFEMSDYALQLQNEIADKLNQLFKDCCIIIKDNECFEDSK
jgi:hypothetical protein